MTDPYSAPYPPAAPDPGLPPGPGPAPAGLAVKFYRYLDPSGHGRHQAVLVTGHDEDGAERGYVLGHVEDAARFPAGELADSPARQEGDR